MRHHLQQQFLEQPVLERPFDLLLRDRLESRDRRDVQDVLDNFNNGSGSTTVADALSTVGLQNTSNKIILTQQSYSADPKVPNPGGTLYPISGANAVCFMDTNLDRSFSMQPFCYNGSNDGVDYGNVGTTLWLWDTWNGGGCMTFRSINTVLDTNNQSFYGDTYTYDSYLNTNGDPSGCPTGSWVNSQQPGWLTDNDNGNTSANGFFWPSIDISTLACGSNLSYGLLQPAVARTANNSVGVPTMCGADFDGYFANIQPRNPYLQVAFTKAAVSGPVSFHAHAGDYDPAARCFLGNRRARIDQYRYRRQSDLGFLRPGLSRYPQ